MIGFDYELSLVKDGKFGAKDSHGNWSGLVGEIVRHDVDLSIAPLTITKERRKAIQFTYPFLDGHLNIVMKKSSQKNVKISFYYQHIFISLLFIINIKFRKQMISIF